MVAVVAGLAAPLALATPAAAATGTFAYVTNFNSNNVSVIDTATNTVTTTIPVGTVPNGVAVAPNDASVYVTNGLSNNVSVIDTSTNTVTATVPVGTVPSGVAVAVVRARATAECPAGSVITGGGFELAGPPASDLVSKPVDNTWEVALTNETTRPITASPYAVCADNTP
ncbi:YncE family protein [Streptomyces sp. NPDC055709]